MPRNALCIKTLTVYGGKAIAAVSKLGIFDKDLKVQRNNLHVYVPIARNPTPAEFEKIRNEIPSFEVSLRLFQERRKHPKTFIEILMDKMPPHVSACLPRSIDFVGDIAIIEIPPELENYKWEIGKAVMHVHKNVRTVLAKAGAVKGTYRLREFEVIAGEDKTETVHKEYGCKYHVDLGCAYFSPRLSYEHKRVASSVKENETVLDMFAGVGPFSILIAKTLGKVKVYALDVNPSAVALLERNVKVNRVEGKVHPVLGDAKQIVKQKLQGAADRVIMNLPEKALMFVDAACEALKPEGGIIHLYSFVKGLDDLKETESRIAEEVEKYGRRFGRILFSRLVRETAPYTWQAVLDAEVF